MKTFVSHGATMRHQDELPSLVVNHVHLRSRFRRAFETSASQRRRSLR